MKIAEIIKMCAELYGADIPERFFNSEYAAEAEKDDTVKAFVTCCNLVLDDLYCDYVTDIKTGKLSASDGFACFSVLEFPVNRVLSLTDKSGGRVRYRYCNGGLKVNADGELTVVYAARAPKAGFTDELPLADVRVNERIFAYGVTAEYCLLSGDYDGAAIWDKRYKDALAAAMVKRSEMRLPRRGWA